LRPSRPRRASPDDDHVNTGRSRHHAANRRDKLGVALTSSLQQAEVR